MQDFKLKLLLSLLGGVVFSFLFILLALAVPIKEKSDFQGKPKGKLEQVSHAIKNR